MTKKEERPGSLFELNENWQENSFKFEKKSAKLPPLPQNYNPGPLPKSETIQIPSIKPSVVTSTIEKNRNEGSMTQIESSLIQKKNTTKMQIPQELLDLLKTSDPKKNINSRQKHKGSSVKIGDIVYFKFTPQLSQQELQKDFQSVITGDGIASNKIESISCEENMHKNALNFFRKSLFRIENSKTYVFFKKYQMCKEKKDEIMKKDEKMTNQNYNKIINSLFSKWKEEQEDNMAEYEKLYGQPVVYGQSIQFRHIYSGCVLTLKSEELARQNGCVEMTLEESDTENSNFKIVPTNNLRSVEDVVIYSDIVNIVNCVEENYFLHIASEGLFTLSSDKKTLEDISSKGIEVNGSEIPTQLKINCYLTHEDHKKNEESQDKYLQNGDIISIFNRETGSTLTISSRKMENYFIEKTINISNAEDKYISQNSYSIRLIDNQKVVESDLNLQVFSYNHHQLTSKTNFNNLWEIQRKKTFDGSILNINESFRLKNVATGLFLAIHRQTNELTLSSTALDIKDNDSFEYYCYFNFISKQASDNEKIIRFNYGMKVNCEARNSNLVISSKDSDDPSKYNLVFSKSRRDASKVLFEIRNVDKRTKSLADRISSLNPYLMKFYLFLQNFGIEKDSKNEDSYKYDYEKALHQEKELENEVKQLCESLENLENFLNVDLTREDEKIFTMRQNILKEQKILDLLINISKLIDRMSRGGKPLKELLKMEKTEKIKVSHQAHSFKNLEKSPFSIALKNLEPVQKRIFNFFWLCVKNNQNCSQLILESDEFFKSQLKYSSTEIASLLKEAIRCSSLLRNNDTKGEQILEWIKLLQPLNESTGNLKEQSLYCELISYCLVDSNDHPLILYQQKCYDELLNKEDRTRGIIKFGMLQENPLIIFYKSGSLQEFLENNPTLANLNPVKIDQNDDEASFLLEDFINECDSNLLFFIYYICASIKLLSYMIKGRNNKSKKKIKELEITPKYIILALKSDKVHSKLKANFLILYQNYYLDVDPYISLSNYNNRCIIWNQLDKFSIKNPSYKIINNMEELLKTEPEYELSITHYQLISPLILEFWHEKGIKDLKLQEEFNYEKDIESILKFEHKLELFLNYLKITRLILDLGYSNKDFNDIILYGISHIFAPILEKQLREIVIDNKENLVLQNNGLNDKYWIGIFIKAVMNSSRDTIKRTCEDIFFQTSRIFIVFASLRLNLQIISFLKLFKDIFKDNMRNLNKYDNGTSFEGLFHIYDFNVESLRNLNTDESPSPKRRVEDIMPHLGNYLEKELILYNDSNYRGVHLDTIFLYTLFSTDFINIKIRNNLLNILIEYFSQRSRILSQLHLIEIIDTEEENIIYEELNGIRLINQKNISYNRLHSLLIKINNHNHNIIHNKDQNKTLYLTQQKEEKCEWVMEILDIINEKFKKYKDNLYLFSKLQNFLRNLNYHDILITFLIRTNKSPINEFNQPILAKIIKFFTNFCYLNSVNQKFILANFPLFLDLMQKTNFFISKLLVFSLESVKSTSMISNYINTLFQFLEKINTEKTDLGRKTILRIYSILRSLLTDEKRQNMISNQKKILSRFLKIKKTMKFLSRNSYVELKNEFMEGLQKSPKNQTILIKIDIHLSQILLFANLAKGFKMGVLQLQKIFVYEQIKSLLYDSGTPYIYKIPYLKLIYHNYIEQLNEVNSNFSPNDMAELLNQIVLPDLNIYIKYLEGIVKIDDKKEQNVSIREQINMKRNYYQSTLEIQEDRSMNIGKKPFIPATLPQNTVLIFENKQILNDVSEYWCYLLGGKTWDNSREGLLYFLMDCYYELNRREWSKSGFESNENLTDVLSLIKGTLVKIRTSLQRLEKDFDLNLINYHLILNECLAQLPTKVVSKAGKQLKIQNDVKGNYKIEKIVVKEDLDNKFIEENQNNKEVNEVLLDKIRSFLISKRLKLNEFIQLLDIKLDVIEKIEFKEKIKCLMKNNFIDDNEINAMIEKLGIQKKNNRLINFRKFIEKLKKIFHKKKFSFEEEDIKKEKDDIELEISYKKDLELRRFIIKYYEKSYINSKNNELKDLARKSLKNIEMSFENSENKENRTKIYVSSLKKLILVFNSESSSIFGIKFLRLILDEVKNGIKHNDTKDNELKAKERLIFTQNAFNSAGVIQYAMSFFSKDCSLYLIFESIYLLINCLEYGNNNIQNSILEILKTSSLEITAPFFNFIRSFFQNQGKESEIDKLMIKKDRLGVSDFTNEELVQITDEKFINKDRVLQFIVKLLSLFCENCFQPFQDFLRNQKLAESNMNFVSNNLIIETSNLLSFLTPSKYIIISEILQTLIEFTFGPCNENQQILCKNKRLLHYLNENFIKVDIDLQKDDKYRLSSFSNAIEFLLSLVIDNNNSENIHNLIFSLDIVSLLNKMQLIYKKKIKKYQNLILEENSTYLNQETRELIETGFNIYILLTILKENSSNDSVFNIFDSNVPINKLHYDELKRNYLIDLKLINPNNPKKNSNKNTPNISPRKIRPEHTLLSFSKSGDILREKDQNEKEALLKNVNSEETDREILKKNLQEIEIDLFNKKHREFLDLKTTKNMKNCLLFFKGLTGCVEVIKDEKLTKLYFQKPFCSDFKTPNIKYHLIYNANRESDQSRLEHLFYNVDQYHYEMKHRQRIYKFKMINFFIDNWRSFKDLSFFLILIINIMQIFTYKKDKENNLADTDNADTLNEIYLIFSIIQLVLCVSVVIFCIYERYPISMNLVIISDTSLKKNNLKNQAGLDLFQRGFLTNLLIKIRSFLEKVFNKIDNSRIKFIKVFFDFENIYNIIYLIITLIAFFNPLVYCILLLDQVKRSEDLQNIIKAVTLNASSLLKTSILGASVLFMFSVIGFISFSELYISDGEMNADIVTYGDTLAMAYASTLNHGLRSGGGIADALGQPIISYDKYWNYWAFSLAFYIIINILFINIIFGIIIDTFGELRDMRKELIHNINEICFICGINSYDFDTKGKGWLEHIYLEHNVYHYLDFLIYIKEKDINNCNGIEKYVKETVSKRNIEFLPMKRALCLDEDTDNNRNKTN